METTRLVGFFVAPMLFFAAATAVQAEMGRRDVVYINGSAKGDGEIVFSFNRPDKDPIEIVIHVPKGAWSKRVNEDVAKRLDHELPGDQFRVDTKDERKIKVEGRTKSNVFELVVTRLTVPGLKVTVREK